jgi:hypothetical protein
MMAKAPAKKAKVTKKKQTAKKVATKAKTKVAPMMSEKPKVVEKNAFEKNFGEGTAFDLDYGKLVIIALLIYVAYQVS